MCLVLGLAEKNFVLCSRCGSWTCGNLSLFGFCWMPTFGHRQYHVGWITIQSSSRWSSKKLTFWADTSNSTVSEKKRTPSASIDSIFSTIASLHCFHVVLGFKGGWQFQIPMVDSFPFLPWPHSLSTHGSDVGSVAALVWACAPDPVSKSVSTNLFGLGPISLCNQWCSRVNPCSCLQNISLFLFSFTPWSCFCFRLRCITATCTALWSEFISYLLLFAHTVKKGRWLFYVFFWSSPSPVLSSLHDFPSRH